MIPIITEEEFLTRNGASRSDIGDAALHKNRGRNSDKMWKKIVERQAALDRDLISRRSELRKEYKRLVEAGELRPPTYYESRIRTAQGHPDNEAVQAARRLLEKRGIRWD